jgi:hypothetical protein
MTSRAIQTLVLLTVFLLAGCASRTGGPGSFSFAMIGDLQYNTFEEVHFPKMLQAIDAESLAFVVHVGDFKAGGNAPCTDTLFIKRLAELNQSRHPLIYTPGDNEWVDCRRPTNGAMNPLERLEKLRELFFAGSNSLGQNRIPLTRQSETFVGDPVLSRYRENALWVSGAFVFATLNIQGSNDNVGFDLASDAEQRERLRANVEWLKIALNRARVADIVGLAIFLQANPGFEESAPDVAKSAFVPFLREFEAEAQKFGKPILFAHGDTHQFRVDRPYRSPIDKRAISNVTRLEGYGSPAVNWVRVTLDAKKPMAPFNIESGKFQAVPAQH